MIVDRVPPILLIEDEADDVSFVRRALEKASITNPLIICNKAAAAREQLTNMTPHDHPALVIVDIFLPGSETGVEFLTWLRAQPPPLGQIAAMIYSVSRQAKHAAAAKELGSVVFLRKPVTEDALANAAQALGFVITTTHAAGRTERVITPRHNSHRAGR
jgi:CheY-like chemotaxis protein